jgi:hypothetical protein
MVIYAGQMTKWPWHADNREDRARRVALSYRRLMELAMNGQIDDPATAFTALDAKWQELGQGWVKPSDAPLDTDDWLTAAELAELLFIDPHSFRNWAQRGRIRVITEYGVRRYCVGDIVSYYAQRGSRAMIATSPSCP